jgi:hypothetical protein
MSNRYSIRESSEEEIGVSAVCAKLTKHDRHMDDEEDQIH